MLLLRADPRETSTRYLDEENVMFLSAWLPSVPNPTKPMWDSEDTRSLRQRYSSKGEMSVAKLV